MVFKGYGKNTIISINTESKILKFYTIDNLARAEINGILIFASFDHLSFWPRNGL